MRPHVPAILYCGDIGREDERERELEWRTETKGICVRVCVCALGKQGLPCEENGSFAFKVNEQVQHFSTGSRSRAIEAHKELQQQRGQPAEQHDACVALGSRFFLICLLFLNVRALELISVLFVSALHVSKKLNKALLHRRRIVVKKEIGICSSYCIFLEGKDSN